MLIRGAGAGNSRARAVFLGSRLTQNQYFKGSSVSQHLELLMRSIADVSLGAMLAAAPNYFTFFSNHNFVRGKAGPSV